MEIKMLETTKGSPDGVTINEYKQGVRDVPEHLANLFIKRGVAKKVKKQHENKMDSPTDNKYTVDDLESKPGGHYYLKGEYLAHGKEEALKELEKINKAGE